MQGQGKLRIARPVMQISVLLPYHFEFTHHHNSKALPTPSPDNPPIF